MRITADRLVTSTELMQELFGMKEKLINNLSEKRRYEKIYEYLIREKDAEEVDVSQKSYKDYTVLECEGAVYLIPGQIFDERDDEWQELVDTTSV